MTRFPPEAEADLLDIVQVITANNGAATGGRVYGRIRAAMLPLGDFPLMGRAGRVEGTREMAVPGLPYIIVYEPAPDAILVLRVIHGAPLWPPGDKDG